MSLSKMVFGLLFGTLCVTSVIHVQAEIVPESPTAKKQLGCAVAGCASRFAAIALEKWYPKSFIPGTKKNWIRKLHTLLNCAHEASGLVYDVLDPSGEIASSSGASRTALHAVRIFAHLQDLAGDSPREAVSMPQLGKSSKTNLKALMALASFGTQLMSVRTGEKLDDYVEKRKGVELQAGRRKRIYLDMLRTVITSADFALIRAQQKELNQGRRGTNAAGMTLAEKAALGLAGLSMLSDAYRASQITPDLPKRTTPRPRRDPFELDYIDEYKFYCAAFPNVQGGHKPYHVWAEEYAAGKGIEVPVFVPVSDSSAQISTVMSSGNQFPRATAGDEWLSTNNPRVLLKRSYGDHQAPRRVSRSELKQFWTEDRSWNDAETLVRLVNKYDIPVALDQSVTQVEEDDIRTLRELVYAKVGWMRNLAQLDECTICRTELDHVHKFNCPVGCTQDHEHVRGCPIPCPDRINPNHSECVKYCRLDCQTLHEHTPNCCRYGMGYTDAHMCEGECWEDCNTVHEHDEFECPDDCAIDHEHKKRCPPINCPKKINPNHTCVTDVCEDGCDQGDVELVVLPCQHVMHKPCIIGYIDSTGTPWNYDYAMGAGWGHQVRTRSECPFCRKHITKEELVDITTTD